MTNLVLAKNGISNFNIESKCPHGSLTGRAVAMFIEECQKAYGVIPSPHGAAKFAIRIIAPVPQKGEDDQTFEIHSGQEDGKCVITVTGTGERGILYGICELLDQLNLRDGELVLPVQNLRSVPDIKRRGVERHWRPSLVNRAELQENFDLIRMLARKRINTLMWIDGWISPGWYRFLTFRHFRPLLKTDEDGAIHEAKACLNEIIEEARRWGMDFYLSGTEFNVPSELIEKAPDLFVTADSGYPVLNLDKQGTWDFYQAKIREVMEDFPGLAGIELWTAEAMDISYCHSDRGDAWTLPQRLEFMYGKTLEAMDMAGRGDAKLVVATFMHNPLGEKAYYPLCGKLPERCEGRMKMQVEDFYRFNDPTKLARKISPGREWVEFDTGGEHRGDWAGWLNAALTYIPERMRHYHKLGVDRFIVRIRGFSLGPGCHCVGDLQELNSVEFIKHDIFFSMCWDMSLSLEEVWRRCNKGRFPDRMLQFFLLSERVSDNAQYINRCLINNNHATFLGSVEHYEYRFRNCDVVNNYECKSRSWILEPTKENMDLIIAEKQQAVDDVVSMGEILDSCHGQMPVGDYEILKKTLAYQEQSVCVFKEEVELYFRYRYFCMTKDPDRFRLLLDSLQRCERAVENLRKHDSAQADTAMSLVSNIKSLTWVQCCKTFAAPKGIV